MRRLSSEPLAARSPPGHRARGKRAVEGSRRRAARSWTEPEQSSPGGPTTCDARRRRIYGLVTDPIGGRDHGLDPVRGALRGGINIPFLSSRAPSASACRCRSAPVGDAAAPAARGSAPREAGARSWRRPQTSASPGLQLFGVRKQTDFFLRSAYGVSCRAGAIGACASTGERWISPENVVPPFPHRFLQAGFGVSVIWERAGSVDDSDACFAHNKNQHFVAFRLLGRPTPVPSVALVSVGQSAASLRREMKLAGRKALAHGGHRGSGPGDRRGARRGSAPSWLLSARGARRARGDGGGAARRRGTVILPADLAEEGAAEKLGGVRRATSTCSFRQRGPAGCGPARASSAPSRSFCALRVQPRVRRCCSPRPSTRRRPSAGLGHLVFIALVGRQGGQPSQFPFYNATKFGLRGLLARGCAPTSGAAGVGVSLVSPGFIRDAGMFADAGAKPPSGPRHGNAGTGRVGRRQSPFERDKIEIVVAPLGESSCLPTSAMASPTIAVRFRRPGRAGQKGSRPRSPTDTRRTLPRSAEPRPPGRPPPPVAPSS